MQPWKKTISKLCPSVATTFSWSCHVAVVAKQLATWMERCCQVSSDTYYRSEKPN